MPPNRGCTYRHRVTEAGRCVPLVEYLARVFRHSDVGAWQARVERGEIDLDDARPDAAAPLRAGQVITWRRPAWHEPDVPTSWHVVFRDAWLLAVDKPSGLPTMPAGGFLDQTLLTLVGRRYPGARPLHRLGRHTSGLVLFARDADAASRLSRAWREHRVEKRYRALASGVIDWDVLEIEAAIGQVPHPRLGTVHAAAVVGRAAQSTVRVVERREKATLVEVDIRTGRPHQVRIHLAWAGHPLVGDPLYASGGVPREHDPALPGDGGYLLHATRLGFEHPVTGEAMLLACDPPGPLRVGS